ncbi:MAG: hypothetical protein ACE10O_05845, partial [Candidatus Acidiferrales bacterium]
MALSSESRQLALHTTRSGPQCNRSISNCEGKLGTLQTPMPVPYCAAMSYWRLGPIPFCLLVIFLSAPLAAEEFYLKDGTKIVGTIVGFEEKAFRVETSFGFAIIYKDKIERIVFTGSTPQPVLGAVPEQTLPSEPVVAESSQEAAAEELETEKSLIQEAKVRDETEEAAIERKSTAEKESAPEPASEA